MNHTVISSDTFPCLSRSSRSRSSRKHYQYALVGLMSLVFGPVLAQDSKPKPVTQQEARSQQIDAKRLEAGYQTQIPGWILSAGDTLQLGQGSQPDKEFAFVRAHTPSSNATASSQKPLSYKYAGQKIVLKELVARGTTANGSSIHGVIDPANLPSYFVALDSAINVGELLPPVKYRPSAAASPALPAHVAQELIKLKAALDAKKITQQEYESRKKKLLE